MKKVINYIYYGFYQIDYVFGIRFYQSYYIGTGGVLFCLSITLYVWAIVWTVVLLVVRGFIDKTYNMPDNDAWLLSVIPGLFVVGWLYYWDEKEKYRKDFEELDKKPSIMRWICFLYAVAFACGGVMCLLGCSDIVRRLTGSIL